MKKVISVLLAVLLLAVACVPAFAADDYKLILTSDKTQANKGDVVTVTLRASTNFDSLLAQITYDDDYFELVKDSVKMGSSIALKDTNTSTAGIVVLGCVGFSDSFAEDNTVATMQFKVLKAGGTIKASVYDKNNDGPKDDAISSANVEVGDLVTGSNVKVEAAPAGPTEGSDTSKTTAKTPASKDDSKATTGKPGTSVNIPKTGGTVSVVASGAAVLAMAAAVAYAMKKKDQD